MNAHEEIWVTKEQTENMNEGKELKDSTEDIKEHNTNSDDITNGISLRTLLSKTYKMIKSVNFYVSV